MTYKDEKKNEAYDMYRQGLSQDKIAKAIGASRTTVQSWIVKHKWKERRDKKREDKNTKIDQKWAIIDEKGMKYSELVLDKSIEGVEEGRIRLPYNAGFDAIKTLALKKGDPTDRIEVNDPLALDKIKKIYEEMKEEES